MIVPPDGVERREIPGVDSRYTVDRHARVWSKAGRSKRIKRLTVSVAGTVCVLSSSGQRLQWTPETLWRLAWGMDLAAPEYLLEDDGIVRRSVASLSDTISVSRDGAVWTSASGAWRRIVATGKPKRVTVYTLAGNRVRIAAGDLYAEAWGVDAASAAMGKRKVDDDDRDGDAVMPTDEATTRDDESSDDDPSGQERIGLYARQVDVLCWAIGAKALAERLGTSSATVASWRRGTTEPADDYTSAIDRMYVLIRAEQLDLAGATGATKELRRGSGTAVRLATWGVP